MDIRTDICQTITSFDYNELIRLLENGLDPNTRFEYNEFHGTMEDFMYYLPFWRDTNEYQSKIRMIMVYAIEFYQLRLLTGRLQNFRTEPDPEKKEKMNEIYEKLRNAIQEFESEAEKL